MSTTAELVHLGDADRFEDVVKESPVPVVVDFYADWCGPCRMVTPILEELVDVTEAPVRVVKVDVDSAPGLAQRFGVRGIPTLVLMENGDELDRTVGVPSLNGLLDWVESRQVA